MRASRSVQARAICASDWPRAAAISFSARILSSDSSVSRSGDSEVGRLAREPSGMPSRYLSVSMPCASGEKHDAADARARRARRAARARSSGSASSTRADGSAAACRGRAGSRRPRASSPPSTTRCRRRAPCPGARRVERAHRLLERRLGIEAVRVEDVDVVEAHPPRGSGRGSRGGTCASPIRRTGRATCRSRPSSR